MAGEDEYMSTSPVETVGMPDCSVEPIDPECIGVFWDVVDFPFPEGLSPDMIYHKMRLFLESLGPCSIDMSILAYVDREQFGDELAIDYEDAGFTIIPRQGDKHARYRSMSLDIAMWELDMHYEDCFHNSLMVLSKEIGKESFFFTFLQSMICLCDHIFVTLDDYLPNSGLERICFNLPLEPIGQSETLLDSSDRKRKRREESLGLSIPDCPVQSTSYECSPHVFWDGVDYPLSYYDAYEVSQTTLQYLYFPAASSLVAYVDEAGLRRETETETETDGITIIPCQGDEKARSHAMLVDIVLWAMENPATYFEQKSLMVVSKTITEETDFFNVLNALHERHYNVVVGMPDHQHPSDPMDVNIYRCDPKRFVREKVVGFSNGLASLYRPEFMLSEILIFWDVNGCPTDFSSVHQVLHNKVYDGKVIVRPYVDMDYHGDDSFGKTVKRVQFKSRIRVGSEGDKYAKVTRMLLDIVFWAMNNDDMPQNLMLISKPFKDTRCDVVIQALERRGFNVIFRPSDQVASIDQSTVGTFASLCKSLPVVAEMHINQSIKSQGRFLTDQSWKLASKPVAVFWLVEECPRHPYNIWRKFRLALERKGYGGILSTFTIITDKRDDDDMRDDMAGVYLIPVSKKDECGKVTRLLMEMISRRRGIQKPANFVVISKPFKDPICERVVEGLKFRGCNVLFELPDYMLRCGRSSRWHSNHLLERDYGN